ncbi:RNA polymerase sigma-70 factor (ECF subfamily) [Paenibacillus cellulosilyticus]|uniref:RNA polymerase sigma-70 factor (ECF subfamily) n=1 Tax=Paenibacillus cellulosilyticus TaxID=375489 RepID=A0A2V2YTW7_9BACL|nr:RNA polymerase sigma factor [Paenibacillus cellulosilyticus]PWW02541.1 RNA polymerase sigma-70 factor (ECF subfamily) [Paenibacillus cellulosilyticus]QKS47237.1 RNA polymerase sigma factor [Paenibacillus cellulosilyticus]
MTEFPLDYERLKQKAYRYCLNITADRWEAEDLTQEVLLRIVRALEIDASRSISNAYIYRIASNAWKDKLKVDKRHLHVSDDALAGHTVEDDSLAARELLETMAHRLSPRAMVIVLLMDVFAFTARETAEFLRAAEGTIQVTLGRARARLKKLAQLAAVGQEPVSKLEDLYGSEHHGHFDLDQLVRAFKRRDARAICSAYLALVKQRIVISKLMTMNGKLAFYMEDPDGNRFMITES